ncbi:zinc finger protein CONSTANS-LIKE 16-like [Salvia divinorum]|uniref:Zinc finger protein CONSTANS-LIKE 16-like n=1 Tax=Salvia divinorum TaxID=28513 RepID=A0ABD1FLL9_SALDI
MVSSNKKLANVVGGKSVRACDNCVRKRATWYCMADDAFLCQSCDSTVHSANPLARRHERVRLKSVSSSVKTFDRGLRISVPSWHKGFTRKARTPRKGKQAKYDPTEERSLSSDRTHHHLVPEISGEENSHDEEQLLYRVPIFDPSVAELNISVNSNEAVAGNPNDGEVTPGSRQGPVPGFDGFLQSEMDLAEFAADVESLLGKGLDEEAFDIEGLGILDDERERERESCLGKEKVKVEHDEEIDHLNIDGEYIGVGRETFELNFDYDSPTNGEDEEVDTKEISMEQIYDYEGVMSAWDEERSPWTTGERPEVNPNDWLSDYADTCVAVHVYRDIGMVGVQQAGAGGDGGREARVSRYREKRRTRLFSKKIRYEVRKLNAEKRPRMKGRFVKRANFVASAALALINK